jgi:hypothetical protein
MGCALCIRCALSIHQKECRKSLGCVLYIGACYIPENTVYDIISINVASREGCFFLSLVLRLVVATVTSVPTHPSLHATYVNFRLRVSQQICLARTLSSITTTLGETKSVRWSYSCTGLDKLPVILERRHTRWLGWQPQKISLSLFLRHETRVRPEGLSLKNPQRPHSGSNPRPSCLQRSASTSCTTVYPIKTRGLLDIVDLKAY